MRSAECQARKEQLHDRSGLSDAPDPRRSHRGEGRPYVMKKGTLARAAVFGVARDQVADPCTQGLPLGGGSVEPLSAQERVALRWC